MNCCQITFRIFIILLTLLDIGVGWYRFYQLRSEVQEIKNDHGPTAACQDPDVYWIIYTVFQSMGTILDCTEIFLICREIYRDDPMCKSCFRLGFLVVILMYILSAIPVTVVSIVFQANCICNETLSFDLWWVEVTVFFRTLLAGASVAFFQVLLHITEIFTKFRRVCSSIGLCRKAETDDSPETMPFFVINIVLTVIYICLFAVEIYFLFCNKK